MFYVHSLDMTLIIASCSLSFHESPRGKRPSPNESATEYEEGTIMTGNDGNKYIVKVSGTVNLRIGLYLSPRLMDGLTFLRTCLYTLGH